MNEKNYPKSYMSETEVQEYLQEGGEELLCIAQSNRARRAGDSETSWDWLRYSKLSASCLDMGKRIFGLDFLKEKNLNLENAILEYGEEWLKEPTKSAPTTAGR